MRRIALVAALALAAGLAAGPAAAGDSHRWSVTIENLTRPGSQPLSPPLFVVHSRHADVWSVGEIANHGVAAIAEDANNAVLESALEDGPGIGAVFTAAGGAIGPGESRTYRVRTFGPYNRLSLLSMLVNTNDGFTGLDSERLRGRGETFFRMAYDAGSERNNELAAYIPGPCCNHPFVRDPEGRRIRMHPGILGVGDLSPSVYGWRGAVARIEVERLS